MPRYISFHAIACLTRQGAEELSARLHRATDVTARRMLGSLYDGKMLVEFDAVSREGLEHWLKSEGFHYDWLLRAELESTGGALAPL